MSALPAERSVGHGTGVASLTVATTIVNGEPLVVCLAIRDSSRTVSSVFFGAEALTQRKTVSSGADCKSEIWDLTAPAVGTDNIVVTLDGVTDICMVSFEIIGSTGYHGGATNSGSGTAATVVYAHTDGKAMVDSLAVGNAAPTDITNDASQELLVMDISNQIRLGSSDKHGGTGWSDNMAWTLAAGQSWALAVVEYDVTPIQATASGSMAFSGSAAGAPTVTVLGDSIDGVIFEDSKSLNVEFP